MSDGWRTLDLGLVATLQRGYDLPYRDRVPGVIPIVTSSGLGGMHSTAMVEAPGVVTGRYGTIGQVFYLEEAFWPLNTTLFVKSFHANDPLFVAYLLRTIDFQSHSGKSGVPGVNRNDLHKLTVRIPGSVHEQRAVATALGDIDALLDALEKLVAKKRDIKQAVMQQLLTGQTRLRGFAGAWENKLLGDLGSLSKGKGIRKDDVQEDGLACIRYGEIYTRHHDIIRRFYSFISSNVARESSRLQTGDIIFAGSGETAEEIGKCVAFLGNEEAYVGGDTILLRPAGQDSAYLGYLLNQPVVAAQKARLGQGDAVVHISAKNLASVEVRMPPIPEQRAIAAVLTDMDAEIAALEARRDKTRLLKRGMMQELLTGRTRLV